MKLLVIFLAAMGIMFSSTAIGSEFASYEAYDSYPYVDYEEPTDYIMVSGDKHVTVDDFTGSCTIYGYTCWGYLKGKVPPTSLRMFIVADKDGKPSGTPISSDSYPCTTTDSGYEYADNPIWRTFVDLSSNPIKVDGTVWMGVNRMDSKDWYVFVGKTVKGEMLHHGVKPGWSWEAVTEYGVAPGDIFKIVDGPSSSLEVTTWAGIKSLY